MSTALPQLIAFTLINELTSTRSTALRICSVPSPTVQSPPDQIRRTSISGRSAPQCINLATFITEQTGSHAEKQQDNIWLLFKIKTLTSSSAKPLVRNTLCSHTYNCGREYLCDYHGNSSVSRRQLSVLCRGRLKTQPVGVARWLRAEQNCLFILLIKCFIEIA